MKFPVSQAHSPHSPPSLRCGPGPHGPTWQQNTRRDNEPGKSQLPPCGSVSYASIRQFHLYLIAQNLVIWLCLAARRLRRCLFWAVIWLSENSITKEEKRMDIGWQSNHQYPACGEEESSQLWGLSWWRCLCMLNVGSSRGWWARCPGIQLCSWLFSSPWCAGLNNGSWKIYVVIPGTCEYIALQSRRNFEDDQIKVLEMGRLSRTIRMGPLESQESL